MGTIEFIQLVSHRSLEQIEVFRSLIGGREACLAAYVLDIVRAGRLERFVRLLVWSVA